jgi:hypothetical protein
VTADNSKIIDLEHAEDQQDEQLGDESAARPIIRRRLRPEQLAEARRSRQITFRGLPTS